MKIHRDRDGRGGLEHFAPSGFFAVRTPLLPFDELLAWADGLESPLAFDNPERLEQTLARDYLQLRERLHVAVSRPIVREALFIAAPELEQYVDLWMHEPESKRGHRIELALVRYFLRMAGRATPFGLFAGTSVGSIADETHLAMEGQAACHRHTRLDMDYLDALVEALRREPSWKDVAVLYPNSSLYHAGGRIRYVEARPKDKRRTYHLVAADNTEYLSATLIRASGGASVPDLAAALVGEDISQTEAEAYITELIENQVLVSDLALPITGPEPIHSLIEQLSENPATKAAGDCLSRTLTELAAMDTSGLGVNPARYRALAQTLEQLPVPVNLKTMFQVDLVKSSRAATLGGAVVDEIVRGVEVLHRLFSRYRPDELERFREAFIARYEQQEVPLLEALDEEIGIGFPPGGAASEEAAPLLKGLALPAGPSEKVYWRPCDALLLRKLADALTSKSQEIVLESTDLEARSSDEWRALPDAFAVVATLAAADDAAVSRGDFRVSVKGVSGPSGASLLGRFCHSDEVVRQQVERHLRTEELVRPDAIFAEVVHLPEGRMGNVLLRPVLRDYEIPYLGRSGAPRQRQIPVTDLRISVRDGRARLFSTQFGREVIPRLTSAHNFSISKCGVYRFLGLLQGQGAALWLGWDWGVLGATISFLPRVVMGRLVLSPARWLLSKEEIKRLSADDRHSQFQVIQKWRAERQLPRWIALADGDNLLPIDLDNALCIEIFIHLIKHRDLAVVVELFPEPGQLCARGPEGRFVHELIIPFVRQSAAAEPPINKIPTGSSVSLRRFAPSSEWLYAKLYTGTTVADRILREVVKPLTEEVIKSGAAKSWFFLRYGDPEWHLRLRFNGAAERLHGDVLPALHAAIAPFLRDGRVWRLQLDTYEREIERYGGLEGTLLAEQLFHTDSESVLEIMESLESGEAGLDERWRLTLRGIDCLLQDFGFDLTAKHALLVDVRNRFAKEFRVNAQTRRQLGEKFRPERNNLEELLDLSGDTSNPLGPGIEIFQRRSRVWAPVIAELQACERAGPLSVSLPELAASYMHMHANRLLRSAHRAQEMVIYDFLTRLYESRIVRTSAERLRPANQ